MLGDRGGGAAARASWASLSLAQLLAAARSIRFLQSTCGGWGEGEQKPPIFRFSYS